MTDQEIEQSDLNENEIEWADGIERRMENNSLNLFMKKS